MSCSSLNRVALCDFITTAGDVRKAYLDAFLRSVIDFRNMAFEWALRAFLVVLRLPGCAVQSALRGF